MPRGPRLAARGRRGSRHVVRLERIGASALHVTPEAAIAAGEEGALLPVYLVTGPEQFLRDQVVAELRTAALGGGVAAFNEDSSPRERSTSTGSSRAARTVPMMAKRSASSSSARPSDGTRARRATRRRRQQLQAGVAARSPRCATSTAPVDSTCLVIVAPEGRRAAEARDRRQEGGFVGRPASRSTAASSRPGSPRSAGDAATRSTRDVAELLAELAGPEMSYGQRRRRAPLALRRCRGRDHRGRGRRVRRARPDRRHLGARRRRRRRGISAGPSALRRRVRPARPRAAAARRDRLVHPPARQVPGRARRRLGQDEAAKAAGIYHRSAPESREGQGFPAQRARAVAPHARRDRRRAQELATPSRRDPRRHADANVRQGRGVKAR